MPKRSFFIDNQHDATALELTRNDVPQVTSSDDSLALSEEARVDLAQYDEWTLTHPSLSVLMLTNKEKSYQFATFAPIVSTPRFQDGMISALTTTNHLLLISLSSFSFKSLALPEETENEFILTCFVNDHQAILVADDSSLHFLSWDGKFCAVL